MDADHVADVHPTNEGGKAAPLHPTAPAVSFPLAPVQLIVGAVRVDVLVVEGDERREEEDGEGDGGSDEERSQGRGDEGGHEAGDADVDAHEDLIDLHRGGGGGRGGGGRRRRSRRSRAPSPFTCRARYWRRSVGQLNRAAHVDQATWEATPASEAVENDSWNERVDAVGEAHDRERADLFRMLVLLVGTVEVDVEGGEEEDGGGSRRSGEQGRGGGAEELKGRTVTY